MSTLVHRSDLWAVTCTSADDGHRFQAAVFTCRDAAEDYRDSMNQESKPAVVPAELWMDEFGRFYKLQSTPVPVDLHLLRKQALAKLSNAERRALGLPEGIGQ